MTSPTLSAYHAHPQTTRALLRAGVILPIAGPPIADGAVRVRDGAIVAVAPSRLLAPEAGESVLELPDCLLLPGLVNAHCHLELGGLKDAVPYPGSFPGWIRAIVSRQPPGPAAVESAVTAGVAALLAGGTTCVGDITTTGLARAPLLRSGIRAVSFRELLGFLPERVEAAMAAANQWLAAHPETGRVLPGLSPHAPYSTSTLLYREAASLSASAGTPLTTHLSESLDEAEFVRHHRGAFYAIQTERGTPPELWPAPGRSPVRTLAELGVLACRGAAAHVNYLEPGDLDLLAAGRMVPVYCPGSHRFFQHPPHPAATMLRAGIPVALGTDSLASNHRLDMLAEARLAWHSVGGSAEQWVRAATIAGARALCLDAQCGTLEPGKRADLIAIRPGQPATDPYAAVLSPGSRVQLTLVDGVAP